MEKDIIKGKKRWYKILASKNFNNIIIGESLCNNISELVGRKLSVNLMSLTNDIKKQGIKIMFSVKGVKGNDAYTDVVSYSLMSAHIKRIMRRSVSKIEDSFICDSKEGKVRVKSYLLTRNKVNRSVRTVIQKKTREYLCGEVKKQSFEGIVDMLVINKLQKNLRWNLSKISPMGNCEIRVFEKL